MEDQKVQGKFVSLMCTLNIFCLQMRQLNQMHFGLDELKTMTVIETFYYIGYFLSIHFECPSIGQGMCKRLYKTGAIRVSNELYFKF